MLERFMTTLDCVDAAFISDQTLDQQPLPAQVGKTRVGGVDMNRPRTRTALAAVQRSSRAAFGSQPPSEAGCCFARGYIARLLQVPVFASRRPGAA